MTEYLQSYYSGNRIPCKADVRTIETYDALLDRDHFLPKVEIVEKPSYNQVASISIDFDIVWNNSIIGAFTLSVFQYPDRESQANLSGIEIKKNLRGKGLGRATYKEIIEYCALRSIRLVSGTPLNKKSRAIWDWLVQKESARVTRAKPLLLKSYEIF